MKPAAIVTAIYAIMEAAGINGVIAGGSARDVLHNMIPKDYDVVVYSATCLDVEAALRRAGQTITATHDTNYGNSDRFEFCVKARIMGVDVDFIGLSLPVTTPEEVIATFDLDINHAWFDKDGTVKIPDYYPAPGQEIYVTSHDITEERTKRLAARFPQYDWADALKESRGK